MAHRDQFSVRDLTSAFGMEVNRVAAAWVENDLERPVASRRELRWDRVLPWANVLLVYYRGAHGNERLS
jgi:hypothetical protein